MILESLTIWRGQEYYFDPAKPLTGKIKFRSPNGDEIQIRLPEESAAKILAIVADGLVEASKKVAVDLTADVINDKQRLVGQDEQPVLS